MNKKTKHFSEEQISKLAGFVDLLIQSQTGLKTGGYTTEDKDKYMNMEFYVDVKNNRFTAYMYSAMSLHVNVGRDKGRVVMYGLNLRWQHHQGGQNGHDIPGPYYFDESINRLNTGTYVFVKDLKEGDLCEAYGFTAKFKGVEGCGYSTEYVFTAYTDEHPEGERRTLPGNTYVLLLPTEEQKETADKQTFLLSLKVNEIQEIPRGDHKGHFVIIEQKNGLFSWAIYEDEEQVSSVAESNRSTDSNDLDAVLNNLGTVL